MPQVVQDISHEWLRAANVEVSLCRRWQLIQQVRVEHPDAIATLSRDVVIDRGVVANVRRHVGMSGGQLPDLLHMRMNTTVPGRMNEVRRPLGAALGERVQHRQERRHANPARKEHDRPLVVMIVLAINDVQHIADSDLVM
jgi:hypothetical protein